MIEHTYVYRVLVGAVQRVLVGAVQRVLVGAVQQSTVSREAAKKFNLNGQVTFPRYSLLLVEYFSLPICDLSYALPCSSTLSTTKLYSLVHNQKKQVQ